MDSESSWRYVLNRIHSWHWPAIPARNDTQGDLFLVMQILSPWLEGVCWRIDDLECVPYWSPEDEEAWAGRDLTHIELLSFLAGIDQIINAEFVGLRECDDAEVIRIQVVDNEDLDVTTSISGLVEKMTEIAGVPTVWP